MANRERKNVVDFKPSFGLRVLRVLYKYPARPPTITQEDLAELEFLGQTLKAAREALKLKKNMIRFGLEQGATIEPGLRSARLEKKARLRIT